MKYRHAKTNWRDLLPGVFSWLDKVEIEKHQGENQGVHYLVPFEKKEKASTVYHCGCQEASLGEEIKSSLSKVGKKNPGLGVFPVEGGAVALVPVSSLDVPHKQKARQIGIDGAQSLRGTEVKNLVVFGSSELSSFDIFDGLVQAWYDLTSFKDKAEAPTLPPRVKLCSKSFCEEKVDELKAMLKATIIARMVADAPPNWMNSEMFAEIAQDLSKELGLKCTVWGRDEILANKMGAFHSVAQGTHIDPKFIAIEIKGKEEPEKWLSLVGKGLTFDSGGISLKPSGGMSEMKYDMCGGSAVLGAAYYLGKVQPPTSVVCLIGAVENMPGVCATRPGDIVSSRSGKTIEVLNTDAEGRLVLADLLHYATETYKPEFVIDVATLTGAVLFALGTIGSSVMSNKPDLCQYLLSKGKEEGEPMWELPMWPELDKELKSDFADLKNIVSPAVKAGSITAAVFLKQFVGKTPWAHFDIAGTGWDCKATGFPKSGSSAFSLRTMVKACHDWKS